MLAKAAEYKAEGNAAFKAGKYKRAITRYRRVFAYTNGLVHNSNEGMARYSRQVDDSEKQQAAAGGSCGSSQQLQQLQ